MDICADVVFWVVLEASYAFVFEPAEICRRSGMTCTCPHHVQLRKDGAKHVPCFWNGRKLALAWKNVHEEQKATKKIAEDLTDADTGNNRDVFDWVKAMLAKKAACIDQFFGTSLYFRGFLRVPLRWTLARRSCASCGRGLLSDMIP